MTPRCRGREGLPGEFGVRVSELDGEFGSEVQRRLEVRKINNRGESSLEIRDTSLESLPIGVDGRTFVGLERCVRSEVSGPEGSLGKNSRFSGPVGNREKANLELEPDGGGVLGAWSSDLRPGRQRRAGLGRSPASGRPGFLPPPAGRCAHALREGGAFRPVSERSPLGIVVLATC